MNNAGHIGIGTPITERPSHTTLRAGQTVLPMYPRRRTKALTKSIPCSAVLAGDRGRP